MPRLSKEFESINKVERAAKTACHHSLMHIDHFLKNVDQWQSHNPVWCLFVCTICVVERTKGLPT